LVGSNKEEQETDFLRFMSVSGRSSLTVRSQVCPVHHQAKFEEPPANKQEAEQGVAHQPAISSAITFQLPFNRAGGRASNVRSQTTQYEEIQRRPACVGGLHAMPVGAWRTGERRFCKRLPRSDASG